ncbi:hypothetical protein AVEN_172717-1 [Araneus ventricosus]|uniref:Uncharacterized protein n=1 Tax=Araneus ventricosus TaxID=182803 RepID=A0A4Y2UUS6_ARAVE|nr:hypothetical protein AVEN_172717-1 [Araneus ventricosus]
MGKDTTSDKGHRHDFCPDKRTTQSPSAIFKHAFYQSEFFPFESSYKDYPKWVWRHPEIAISISHRKVCVQLHLTVGFFFGNCLLPYAQTPT